MEATNLVEEELYEIDLDNQGCHGGPKAGRLRALANVSILLLYCMLMQRHGLSSFALSIRILSILIKVLNCGCHYILILDITKLMWLQLLFQCGCGAHTNLDVALIADHNLKPLC